MTVSVLVAFAVAAWASPWRPAHKRHSPWSTAPQCSFARTGVRCMCEIGLLANSVQYGTYLPLAEFTRFLPHPQISPPTMSSSLWSPSAPKLALPCSRFLSCCVGHTRIRSISWKIIVVHQKRVYRFFTYRKVIGRIFYR